MWGTDSNGHLHSNNRPVLNKQQEVTYTRKLRFCSSCKYTRGCGAPASWAARHTTVCLDFNQTWYQDAPLHHLSVYQFQGYQITRFHFMVTVIPRRKENEETEPIFGSSYLGNAWRHLVEIWDVRHWHWRASPQQKSSSFVQAVRSYVYAKIALLFFLFIYSWVLRAGFLGRTTHYRVSWS